MFRQVVAQFNQLQVRAPLAQQAILQQHQVLILLISKMIPINDGYNNSNDSTTSSYGTDNTNTGNYGYGTGQ